MALGGLLCLFGVVLTCKLHEGNRALAGDEPPAAAEKKPADAPAKDKAEEKGTETKKAEGPPKPPEKPAPLGVTMPMPEAPPAPPSPPLPPGADGAPESKPVAGSAGGPPPNAPPTPSAVFTSGLKAEAPVAAPPTAPPPAASVVPPPADAGAGSASSVVPLAPPSATPPATPPAAEATSASVPPPTTTTVAPPPPPKEEAHPMPGEPPLAPAPGPVQTYQVRAPETLRDLARHTMGSSDRWADIYKLNPSLKPEATLPAGTVVRLPGDACVQPDDVEPVKPLPALRPKAPAKAKVVLPLTGTFPCNLDDKKAMTLPKAIRDQLGNSDTVLISPGPDKCLWLTNQAHLERLAQRLEQSPAREVDVRVFRRLYFAQTEKTALTADGRVAISERLAQFAGLHQEVVLVGIDDHFELWDAARWRQYTQQKSAAAKAALADHE
jgi:MraZ protein